MAELSSLSWTVSVFSSVEMTVRFSQDMGMKVLCCCHPPSSFSHPEALALSVLSDALLHLASPSLGHSPRRPPTPLPLGGS